MAGPIARRPAGLLDLLLTQQQGKNPSELGDMLSPIIDLLPFYAQDRLSGAVGNKACTAVGDNVGITVPAGESWLVWTTSFSATFATVNQNISVYVELRGAAGTTQPVYLSDLGGLKSADGATDIVVGAQCFDKGLMIPSGTELRFVCGALNLDAQANITFRGRVLYARMET